MLAQYTGEGFYRMKNNGTAKRYISIVNDTVYSGFKSIGLTELNQIQTVNALRTVKNPVSDPGTIIYISGSTGDLSLEGQGLRTQDLLKGYKLNASGSNDAQQLSSEYKGTMIILMDDYDADTKKDAAVGVGVTKVAREANQYASWNIIKVDNENEYLGIVPEITIGDKYYTTLYTSYAYQLSEGMKAYYVSEHEYSDTKIAEPAAVLKEITGKVPAATPVILECTSNKAEDNKLTPLKSSDAPSAVSGNELKGIYFCYIKMKDNDKDELENQKATEEKNATAYESSSMRVLGSVNGQLALIQATDKQLVVTNKGKYLPANKAYFPIKASEANSTKNGIMLVDKTAFDAALTAITNVTSDEKATKSGVFTLTGVRAKADNSTEGLSNGIYVINGKKVIVK